jgi:hypothetical protein
MCSRCFSSSSVGLESISNIIFFSGVTLQEGTVSRVDSLPTQQLDEVSSSSSSSSSSSRTSKSCHGSTSEKIFFEIVGKMLTELGSQAGSKTYSLRSSEHLDGCFEADILISEIGMGSGEGGGGRGYNIEIDGPSHSHPVTRRLCTYRDMYLEEVLGVEIVRIDIREDVRREGGLTMERMAKLAREALEMLGLLSPLPPPLPPVPPPMPPTGVLEWELGEWEFGECPFL